MKPTLLEVAKRADEFFMNKSPIHDTMKRLAVILRQMDISFAIAGAMAANAHGHRRTTADVDVLLRAEDLKRFKDQWIGRGWVEKFEGSKGFRDTQSNVPVDVLISGDFPGDGLDKPIAFPAPETASEIRDDGLPYLSLLVLLELKLASGMTAVHRPRDLDDVIQLIRANGLPLDYGRRLNPYVLEKYEQLWHAAQIEEDY